MKIAIVGSGISGLVSAYLLRSKHDLTIFEAADWVGGHTHTIPVPTATGTAHIDTGFIVYNEAAYPNFKRLLEILGVATQPSRMSFSVHCDQTGLEYCGDTLLTMFAQRRNLFRPSFYRILRDIARFYREAPAVLDGNDPDHTLTTGAYLAKHRYSDIFIQKHILPMGAAVWSARGADFADFPVRHFVQFFQNHGMLQIAARPIWRVIRGGSHEYVKKLTASYRARIRLNTPVAAIRRHPEHVEIRTQSGDVEQFDEVIIATHSDQAVQLLADATPIERDVLGAIDYQENDVVLHTDERLMPRRRRAWASWNYHLPASESNRATVTYYMNMLQTLKEPKDYFVTLNRTGDIDPQQIIGRYTYHHPSYTESTFAAQRRHREISGVNRTHYCGAYWGYGFHEDGVRSALAACEPFGGAIDHE